MKSPLWETSTSPGHKELMLGCWPQGLGTNPQININDPVSDPKHQQIELSNLFWELGYGSDDFFEILGT